MNYSQTVKIYEPRHGESLFTLLREIFRGFRDGRELAWRLFVRDLMAGYKKSLLGPVWLFLPPLGTAGIWIFLNSQKVVQFTDTPMKYAAFTLCGTLLWSLFAEAILKPIQRYQQSMSMMVKLNFPREAIALASLYDLAFSLVLKLLILVPVLWILGYPPSLFFLPAILASFGLAFFGFAMGLAISPVGLLYTDVSKGLSMGLPFLMYLTPVIYPMRTGGAMAWLQGFNPVTPFIERARSLFGGYAFSMSSELWLWAVISIFLLLLGLIALRIALPIIVERSGS